MVPAIRNEGEKTALDMVVKSEMDTACCDL
jgi:hypothetical protein